MGVKKHQRPRNPTTGGESNRLQQRGIGVPGSFNADNKKQDSLPGILWALVTSLLRCGIWTAISLPFWFLTHSLSLVYGRPPQLVYFSQTVRYLRFVWSVAARQEQGEASSFSTTHKIRLSATIFIHSIMSPLYAFGWILDEILYGRRLSRLHPNEQAALDNPVFVVSAFRSASTQMARTLVAETKFVKEGTNESSQPCFVAPNAMMCAYPYLWLWNIVYSIVGEIPERNVSDEDAAGITKEDVRQKFNSGFTPDSLARHPNDPFQLDTFDGTFLNYHLNGMVWQLCSMMPSSMIEQEFNYAQQKHPLNKRIWEEGMVRHIDRLARKTLVFCANDEDSSRNARSQSAPTQRFLLKGHFLSICPQLRAKYRGGKFLTILRDPCSRLRSGINYMAVNPTIYSQDPSQRIPWKALAEGLRETEAQYCEREIEWFCDTSNKSGDEMDKNNTERLAVAFDSFVANKDKTIWKIIDWTGLRDQGKVIIGISEDAKKKPQSLPRKKKAPTVAQASAYRIDRSLAELGVDEAAYRKRLGDYLSWMKDVSLQ